MNCNENEEIIIEVEINMCLTIQNISTISAEHLLGTRMEAGLLRFFWNALCYFSNIYRNTHGKIYNQSYG
jgi:hypothetical protein